MRSAFEVRLELERREDLFDRSLCAVEVTENDAAETPGLVRQGLAGRQVDVGDLEEGDVLPAAARSKIVAYRSGTSNCSNRGITAPLCGKCRDPTPFVRPRSTEPSRRSASRVDRQSGSASGKSDAVAQQLSDDRSPHPAYCTRPVPRETATGGLRVDSVCGFQGRPAGRWDATVAGEVSEWCSEGGVGNAARRSRRPT